MPKKMNYHVLISSTNKLIFRFPKLSSKYIQASGSLFSSCRGWSGRDTEVPAARMDRGGAGPGLARGQAFSYYRGMGSLTLATTFAGRLMCVSRGSTWQMLLQVLGAAVAGAAVAGAAVAGASSARDPQHLLLPVWHFGAGKRVSCGHRSHAGMPGVAAESGGTSAQIPETALCAVHELCNHLWRPCLGGV